MLVFFFNRRVGLPIISLCSLGSTASAGYTVWLSNSDECYGGGKQSNAEAVHCISRQLVEKCSHTDIYYNYMHLYRIIYILHKYDKTLIVTYLILYLHINDIYAFYFALMESNINKQFIQSNERPEGFIYRLCTSPVDI